MVSDQSVITPAETPYPGTAPSGASTVAKRSLLPTILIILAVVAIVLIIVVLAAGIGHSGG